MKVGFVGVGAMGSEMARHVKNAGFEVLAFDADEKSMSVAASKGIAEANSLTELGTYSDVIILVVNTDSQTEAVVDSLLETGAIDGKDIVVAATNHPATMIALAGRCAEQGAALVDAPVCYGLQGAKHGNLISLTGGTKEAVDRIRPILMAYSRSVEYLGPSGCGQLGKACNNMMHWAACVANFETLTLARACGIDAQAMRETLLKCPARNTTLERWDTTKFTWHEKDMDVVLDLSQQAGLALPLFGAVDQLIKRLGPDDVRALLHGENTGYLGQPVEDRKLAEIFDPTG
jgi:3-hydroxyisobutyrate dehydrogenase-like beta-hydroxyacid dehydrogenase